MITRLISFVCLTLAVLFMASTAVTAQALSRYPTTEELSPTLKCEGLRSTDFSRIPDAPTTLMVAKLIGANAGAPDYCEVEGYISPQVGILMWLPASGWNGKYLQVGCGGFCGNFDFIRDCVKPLTRGYACLTTDMGHKGTRPGGVEWAYNNLQAVVDFAYRATHVSALAGKAIVAIYYGRKPDRSYFSGCSCGGRQALIEAQRFPWDFDGIIAGAPALDYSDLAMTFAYRARIFHDANGNFLFDDASVKVLHDAVVSNCDMNDGLKDGLIGDPRLCRYDPRKYICAAGRTRGCLSKEQADAAVGFYAERFSGSKVRIGEGRYYPGSEISLLGLSNSPLFAPTFYEDYFRFMGLIPNPGASWKFGDFDLNVDYQRLGMIDALIDATNPDYSRFKKIGGKLILFDGWADGGPSQARIIDLYQTIERTMGGRSATESFMRLFMIPDMDHCTGGNGAWEIDYLDYLEKWVEQGKAPNVMIGAHYTAAPNPDPVIGRTIPPNFTRPVFPYPFSARYKGSGDPNDASSFRPVALADPVSGVK